MRNVFIILGAIVIAMRHFRRNWVVYVACIAVMLAFSHNANSGDTSYATLRNRIAVLERACVPRYTGGGVTQCANPSEFDIAFQACMNNDAYIGVTEEDTRHLFVQCVDDYMRMRGWR